MSRYIDMKDKCAQEDSFGYAMGIIPALTSQRGSNTIRREIAWNSTILHSALQGKRARHLMPPDDFVFRRRQDQHRDLWNYKQGSNSFPRRLVPQPKPRIRSGRKSQNPS